MSAVFWICSVLAFYAYFGYPIVLWLVSIFKRPKLSITTETPTVSIIIAARNEEANLRVKLEGLRLQSYPVDRIQIVVASDGSTDGTAGILAEQGARIVPVILADSNGKATALNKAVECATGEILIFMDARQQIDPNAVAELVRCFADHAVGAVSGELLLHGKCAQTRANGLGIYWKIEKAVRKLESASGSVIGVTGALYAIRRNLYTEIPPGTILDDVFVPMNVVRKGGRVIIQPSAIAYDHIFDEKGKEFSRKVRTLTGNYQLLRLAPWLLSPSNPLLFRFVSHKLLRLMVPILLILVFVASAATPGGLYRGVFWLQALVYSLAALGTLFPLTLRCKPVAIASTFVMLNAAAMFALYNFIMGRNRVWR